MTSQSPTQNLGSATAERLNAIEAYLDPRRQAKKTTWLDVGILWGLYLGIISVGPALSFGNYLQFQWIQIQQSKAAEFLGLVPTEEAPGWAPTVSTDSTPLLKGSTVGKFKVTSGMGPRVSPGGVGSTNHQGVDLNTPVGTKVYAPVTTKVSCLSSTGGGTGARFKGVRGEVTLWHLSQCAEGRYKAGEVFALTGNTGAATTGPHLHVEVRDGGKVVNPEQRDVASLLGASQGTFSIDRYLGAIAKQESGSDYTKTNQDGSGAMGKYQFMPGTMRATAKACLGVTPTEQEFLGNPELQDQVMHCHVESKLETIKAKSPDPMVQCRMLAAVHYSGSADLWNSTKAQTYNGRKYPSIADYTQSVCNKVIE